MKGMRQIDWYSRFFFPAPSFLTLQLKSKAPPGVIEGRRVFESQLKKYIRSKVERIKSLNSKLCSFKEDILCVCLSVSGHERESKGRSLRYFSHVLTPVLQTPTSKNMWPICLDISEVPQKASLIMIWMSISRFSRRTPGLLRLRTACGLKMAKLHVLFTLPSTPDLFPLGKFRRLC